MFKFIHAGDVHLGNSFVGLRDIPDWLIEKLQRATLDAFIKLVDVALLERVDLVLLPGDVYNTNELNPKIQLFLMEQFERLQQQNIPVIINYGNHDFLGLVDQSSLFPKNVYILGSKVETLYFTTAQGEKVAVSGFSYSKRHITENMVKYFPIKQDEKYHIGMYHGELGTEGKDDYAPFNLNDINAKHYQYWALGHIHVRKTLQEYPFIGYSGSLQGLNHKESGLKGFYLVKSDENNQLHPTFYSSAPIIWKTEVFKLKVGQEIKAQDLIKHLKNVVTQHENVFVLIQLKIETYDRMQMQILKSNAFYQQLKIQLKPTDNIYIYQLDVQVRQLESVMPELPDKIDIDYLDQLVTLENLSKIGLNLIDNPFIFKMLTSPDNLEKIKQQMKTKLENIQGGVKDVD